MWNTLTNTLYILCKGTRHCSSQESEVVEEPLSLPERRRKARRPRRAFIETEAGVDSDASEDESENDDDLADFFVDDKGQD